MSSYVEPFFVPRMKLLEVQHSEISKLRNICHIN